MEWETGGLRPGRSDRVRGVYGASALHWKLSKLTGSVEEKSVDAGGNPFGCSGSFSPDARGADGGIEGVFVPLETPAIPPPAATRRTNGDTA